MRLKMRVLAACITLLLLAAQTSAKPRGTCAALNTLAKQQKCYNTYVINRQAKEGAKKLCSGEPEGEAQQTCINDYIITVMGKKQSALLAACLKIKEANLQQACLYKIVRAEQAQKSQTRRKQVERPKREPVAIVVTSDVTATSGSTSNGRDARQSGRRLFDLYTNL